MDDLTAWLDDRLDADDTIDDEAKYLVLAALEGDAALEGLTSGAMPHTREPGESEPAPPPVGAYLKSITVQGFRGIGERATLELQPKPGLTIIAGRNGSGKSSFAEALEVALTQTSYRWKNGPSQWSSTWRNLHATASPEIAVVLAQEEVGKTTIGVTWDGDNLSATKSTLQRHGEKRETGIGRLGWTAPLDAYRPLLSYEELGKVLSGGPSKLYDSLARILGLDQVTDAIKRLGERRRGLEQSVKELAATKNQLRTTLAGVDDERARTADALLAKQGALDTTALRSLAAGTADQDETTQQLRALAGLSLPSFSDVDRAAEALASAVEAMADAGDAATAALERRIDLTTRALDLHRHDGDQACPVCGEGLLDATWAERARAAADADHHQVSALKAARKQLAEAGATARGLVSALPSALEVAPTGVSTDSFTAVREAWTRWAAIPETNLEAATHLRTTLEPLATALASLQAEVHASLVRRDETWTPVASQLAAYADDAERCQACEAVAASVKSAHTWLKKHDVELKNQRIAPIADQTAEIWRELRQESNVDINGLALEGASTRRRVTINAAVDGADAGALSVMSQGELHALSLALFLPRATMAESPFRFVVLDDPVQAMDPAKVDGLVATLSRIAKDRQVVVFSHDDRLASAVRRAPVNAQIWEVTRFAKSKVEIVNTYEPASRYLRDAHALLKDERLPDATLRMALPGMLRLAVESAAKDRYWTEQLSGGATHRDVEKTWDSARKTRDRVGLALYGKVKQLDAWLEKDGYRRRGLGVCTSGFHNGLSGDPFAAYDDVKRMVADLKTGAR